MRGEREEAERELSKLEMLSDSRYVCPYEIATARAALGQRDQAFGGCGALSTTARCAFRI